jgi:hypothetical protein
MKNDIDEMFDKINAEQSFINGVLLGIIIGFIFTILIIAFI